MKCFIHPSGHFSSVSSWNRTIKDAQKSVALSLLTQIKYSIIKIYIPDAV